ncbi:hypothetical protein GIB67_041507, partial [Kingdonia uniflora]
HRFYGESLPFGESYKYAHTLGYLYSEQALVDFAILIRSLKQNLSSEASPAVVFGGSYGGMLAAWFRPKYPRIAIRALASSAPILQFDDITPWTSLYDVVSQDYKDVSLNCYEVIKGSWSELEALSTQGDSTITFEEETTREEILSLKNALKFFDTDFFSESKVGEMAKDAKEFNIHVYRSNRKLVASTDGGLHDPSVLVFNPKWGGSEKHYDNKRFAYPSVSSIQRRDREEDIAVLSFCVPLCAVVHSVNLYWFDVALEAVVSYIEDLAFKQAKEADSLLDRREYLVNARGATTAGQTDSEQRWKDSFYSNRILSIRITYPQRDFKLGKISFIRIRFWSIRITYLSVISKLEKILSIQI